MTKEIVLINNYNPLQKDIINEFIIQEKSSRKASFLTMPTNNLVNKAKEMILANHEAVLAKSNVLSLQRIAEEILGKVVIYQVISPEETFVLLSKVVLGLLKDNKLTWFSQLDSIVETIDEIWNIIASIKKSNLAKEIDLEGLSDKEKDIAIIFNEYQKELFSQELLDQEEIIRQAAIELEKNNTKIDGNTLMIYDYQLSMVEVNFINELANHFSNIKIYLHYNLEQKEMFRDLNESIKLLKGNGFKVFVQNNSKSSESNSLYLNNNNLEISVGGAYTKYLEIRQVLREVKRLILTGTSPQEIAIVGYNLRDYQDLLIDVAKEFAIPIDNIVGNLGQEVFTKHLLTIFSLLRSDFKKNEFIEFLRLEIDWPEEIKVASLLKYVRLAPYDGPMAKWQAGVHMLQDIKDKDMLFTHHELRDINLSLFHLKEIFSLMPSKGSYSDFYNSYLEINKKLNFSSYLDKQLEKLNDEQAEKLYSITAYYNKFLSNEDKNDLWPREITYNEFLEILKNILNKLVYKNEKNIYQSVKLYNPLQIAGLAKDYVFLIGANEGVVPKSYYSWIRGIDDDDLHNLGIDLVSDDLNFQKNQLIRLFSNVKKAICITYLKEDYLGKEGYLSPFIVDILEALEQEEENIRVLWPEMIDVASQAEHMQVLAIEKQLTLLKTRIQIASNIEKLRAQAEASPYNGVLSSMDLLEFLQSKFSDHFVMSTSMLEEYGKCPFAFMLKRVLMIREIDEFEPGLTPLSRGSIIHNVLADFLSDYLTKTLKKDKIDEYKIKLDNYLQIRLTELVHTSAISNHWIELEQKRFKYLLEEWLNNEIRLQENVAFRPIMLEKSFSHQITRKKTLRYTGYIDRIDKSSDSYIIYDYKSGSPPKMEDIEDGIAFQLPLYLQASREIYKMEKICGGGYYRIGSSFSRNSGMWVKECLNDLDIHASIKDSADREQWEELLDQTIEKAFEYRELMKQGYYPLSPKKIPTFCKYCTYKDICRLTAKLSSRLEDADELY